MPGCDVEPGRRTCRDCPNWTSCDDPQGLALRVARAEEWFWLHPTYRTAGDRPLAESVAPEGVWYEVYVGGDIAAWSTGLVPWSTIEQELHGGEVKP